MRIFFTASLRAKQLGFEKSIESICDVLATHHDLYAKHIQDQNLDEVRQWNFDKRLSYYNTTYKEIKKCDMLVAEITYPSVNVGYEIALALESEKQVILLHQNGNQAIFDLIHAEEYEDQLHVLKYREGEVIEKLELFLKSLTASPDKRFTLLLPSYILNHLSKVSKQKKMPRAVYIRKLIEKDMHE